MQYRLGLLKLIEEIKEVISLAEDKEGE